MKTSYFSNIRNVSSPLSISQHPPKWYTGAQFKLLAPPWSLVEKAHKGLSREEYAAEFEKVVLAPLDPRETYDEIVKRLGNDVTLLCFEKLENPGDFCHRRLVAEWFEKHLNIEVPEWTPPPKIKSTLSF